MPRRLILLMVAAPAAVVGSLLVWRSVVLVFAVYHLGICLLLPVLIDVRLRRWSWQRHLRHLGVTGPGTARGIGLGVILAGFAGLVVHGALLAGGDRLQTGNAVAAVLRGWGVEPGRVPGLILFMAIVNGPAEELFWRGFLAAELRPAAGRVGRLIAPSLLYASYHAVTIPALVRVPWMVALMLAAVLAAGLGWAWLRERTGSVWPALLSHGAAAAAYILFAQPLLLP